MTGGCPEGPGRAPACVQSARRADCERGDRLPGLSARLPGCGPHSRRLAREWEKLHLLGRPVEASPRARCRRREDVWARHRRRQRAGPLGWRPEPRRPARPVGLGCQGPAAQQAPESALPGPASQRRWGQRLIAPIRRQRPIGPSRPRKALPWWRRPGRCGQRGPAAARACPRVQGQGWRPDCLRQRGRWRTGQPYAQSPRGWTAGSRPPAQDVAR